MDYQAEWEKLKNQKDGIEAQMKRLEGFWVDSICPYKPGARVEICGYSSRGKTGVVSLRSIRFGYNGKPEWKVEGYALKKDGSTSKHWFEFTESQQIEYNKLKV